MLNLEIVVEFDCLFTFCFLAGQKKRRNKESLWNIFILITQPFLYLEGALKSILQEQFKNTTTKVFQVNNNFKVRRKFLYFEYDMIYAKDEATVTLNYRGSPLSTNFGTWEKSY